MFHGSSYLARYDDLFKGTANSHIAVKVPKAHQTVSVVDEVSLYGYRPCDSRIALLSPWEFIQRCKHHALQPPSSKYEYSVWICKPNEGERALPGTHYSLNLKKIEREKDFLMIYPPRRDLPYAAQKAYDVFRQSWIIVLRDRPVVPCPEQTPIPCRGWSKERRAKVFSIYLRPWTLVPDEASVDVPYILDLDLNKEAWLKKKQLVTTKQDLDGLKRSMRDAWKEYLYDRVPSAFATQVRNFIKTAFAENHGREEDDAEGTRRAKMEAVQCPLRPQDLNNILQTVPSGENLEDPCTEKRSSAEVTKATKAVDALMQLQSTCILETAQQTSLRPRLPAAVHLRKLDATVFQRTDEPVVDDPMSMDIGWYTSNWKVNYRIWRLTLQCHPTKTPYDKQWLVLDAIHKRCVQEHLEESRETAEPSDPLSRLLHGYPGAGKSQLLLWIRSYFVEVWHWEEGVHFKFLAPMNTMAANIAGATLHAFGAIQFKDRRGMVSECNIA